MLPRSLDHKDLLFLVGSSILAGGTCGCRYPSECRAIGIKRILIVLFVRLWHHPHLLLLCLADFSLVTVGSPAALASHSLEIHFVLVLGIQHAAIVLCF